MRTAYAHNLYYYTIMQHTAPGDSIPLLTEEVRKAAIFALLETWN